MEHVAWGHIVVAGWPVLTVLLAGSIVTVAVIMERWKIFSEINPDSTSLLNSLRDNSDAQKIISWCDKSDQPLAKITKAIYQAPADREEKERLMQRAIQSIVQHLETHVALLGTIASVAPFVGLLGTVIGIIRAFRAVSMTESGASVVALGIAEALVGTAGGLVVAIPALLAYNYFVNKTRRFVQSWELAGDEIIDLSLKRGR